MPQADPGRDSLFKYLKHRYPWKFNWDTSELPNIKDEYSYEEIKDALQNIKQVNPEIWKYMGYLINSGRNRNDLGSFLGCDTSTLKRKCNRGFDIMLNYLNNKNSFYPLKKIDLINPDIN